MSGHNWKDYSSPITTNGPYSYENFGVAEDPDGNNLSSAGHKHLNGKNFHPQPQNGIKHSSQHHRMMSTANGKYYSPADGHKNGYDLDKERPGMPLPAPPVRPANGAGLSNNHHSNHHSSSHHHNPHDGGGGRSRGERHNHPPSSHPTPHASSLAQQLQPDFYFMPHQRRYSGEVVRVFVDYNNRENNQK